MTEALHERLRDLALVGAVARYTRRTEPGVARNGIVVVARPELVVVQSVDDAMTLDGYAALRTSELGEIDVAPYDLPVRRVLAQRGLQAVAPGVPSDSWAGLLRGLVGMAAVVVHDVEPDTCWIGPISCLEGRVLVHCIAPDGEPDDDRELAFDQVTMVQWDTRYDEAVHIMSQSLS